MPTRKRTALVLAGGGSLGAVQVGMLSALVQRDIKFDFVVGASVGAINGAYFAGNPDMNGIQQLKRIWLGLRRDDIFPVSWIGGLRNLLLRQSHTVSPDALARLIRRDINYQNLEHASLPFHVVATDLLTGSEVLLSEGQVETALLASAAIPVVFPSVKLGNQYLIDGGIANNTPISSAIALGATQVFVIPTGMACALTAPPRGLLATALHSLNLLAMRQLARDVEMFSGRAEIVVVPPLCPVAVNVFDFSQTANLIDRAEQATADWLRNGGIERQGLPPELQPHSHS